MGLLFRDITERYLVQEAAVLKATVEAMVEAEDSLRLAMEQSDPPRWH